MIIHLYITTWQGVSLGAEHYYAELQGDHKSIELKNTLSLRQAINLNKKAHDYSEGRVRAIYKPGDEHRGFDTHEDAVQAGIDSWLDHFPDGEFLVLGNSAYVEPKPLLASTLSDDASLKQQIQSIVDKCEAIGWFDKPGNDDKMDEYYNEWAKLLGLLGTQRL